MAAGIPAAGRDNRHCPQPAGLTNSTNECSLGPPHSSLLQGLKTLFRLITLQGVHGLQGGGRVPEIIFREKGIRLRLEKWRIYDVGT